MEDGPPMFRQDNTCPVLLDFTTQTVWCTGLSPFIAGLSRTVPLPSMLLKGWPPFARRY